MKQKSNGDHRTQSRDMLVLGSLGIIVFAQ